MQGPWYLFCKRIDWCKISVALAVDGGACTSTNSIHFPVSVVIVHHMEISMSAPAYFIKFFYVRYNSSWIKTHRTKSNQRQFEQRGSIMYLPWHPLDQTLTKMVIGNCHLHLLVSFIRITVAQQHHLFGSPCNNIGIPISRKTKVKPNC